MTNAWLLETPRHNHVLIDAPEDAPAWLDQLGITPAALLLTHQHFDHVMTAAAIAARGVPVYAWEDFSRELTLEEVVREWGMPFEIEEFPVRQCLSGESQLTIDGLSLELRHVPGHSTDSVVFRDAERGLLFGGDTLFSGSTGRADLPGGDFELLRRGISEKLYTLPEDTRVFPGHGEETTIGEERRSNAVVRS